MINRKIFCKSGHWRPSRDIRSLDETETETKFWSSLDGSEMEYVHSAAVSYPCLRRRWRRRRWVELGRHWQRGRRPRRTGSGGNGRRQARRWWALTAATQHQWAGSREVSLIRTTQQTVFNQQASNTSPPTASSIFSVGFRRHQRHITSSLRSAVISTRFDFSDGRSLLFRPRWHFGNSSGDTAATQHAAPRRSSCCKNGWTDRDAVWISDSCGFRKNTTVVGR